MTMCAAPNKFSFGKILTITGGWTGTVKVVDRGGAIKDKRLDIWMGDKTKHQEALKFGNKTNCTIKWTE